MQVLFADVFAAHAAAQRTSRSIPDLDFNPTDKRCASGADQTDIGLPVVL